MENNKDNFPYIIYSILITSSVMFVYFMFGAVASYFFDVKSSNAGLIVTGIAQLVIIFAPLFILVKTSPLPSSTVFRLHKKVKLEYWLLAISAIVIVQFLNSTFIVIQEALLPDSFQLIYDSWKKTIEDLYTNFFVGATPIQIGVIFVIAAIVPAFAEEFLFRGFLQRHLEVKLKPIYAILITSAIFSIIHFNIVNIFPLFFIGMVLGICAYASGSIKLPVAIHLLNNAAAVYIYQNEYLRNMNSKTMPLWMALFIFFASLILIGFIFFLFFLFKRKQEVREELKTEV